MYVLGAACAPPAPKMPPATAVAATKVALARNWRLLIELDMKTSSMRKVTEEGERAREAAATHGVRVATCYA
ncbi:hypothetical protein GCM10009540_15930 [Streptomyces turgidiscabies]